MFLSTFTSGRLDRRFCRAVVAGLGSAFFLGGVSVAVGGQDSRVVVVQPQPGGTQVPVAPNERVTSVTGVNLPGRGPVVVVGLKTMPVKADFNIITPDGTSHPFNRTHNVGNGITVVYEVQVINNPPAPDRYRVYGTIKRGGAKIGHTSIDFPAGSQYVPDPPQPPGTFFMFPDGIPLPPPEEAMVLAEAGLPDLPGPQAYYVPSGMLLFTHPGGPIAPVHVQGGAAKGDMNCDTFITVADIGGFVLALTDTNAYEAAYPECDLYAADVNLDDQISVSDIGGMVALLTGA